MVIWSGWGILVVVFAVAGLVAGVMCADLFTQYLGLPYGQAQAAGIGVGGLAAAVATLLFARWRESGEARVLIDEATGQRIEMRPSAGSLFFIPTRFWPFIILALAAFMAYTQFGLTEPPSDY